jgi:hypothetical protein
VVELSGPAVSKRVPKRPPASVCTSRIWKERIIMICLYVLLLEPCMKRGCCDHENGEWLCVNTEKSTCESSSLHTATLQERKMYLSTTASAEYQTQRSCVFVLPGFPFEPAESQALRAYFHDVYCLLSKLTASFAIAAEESVLDPKRDICEAILNFDEA